MTNKPKAVSKIKKPETVAEYIDWQVSLCGKTQREIADQAGFAKANIITMIKNGDTKVPLEKIGKLAKALEVDPIFFYKMCLQEYLPGMWDELEKIFGQPALSQNEVEILEVIRSANVVNPRIRTDTERRRLLDVINTLKPDNATN